jgi:hypothetical protein
MRRRTVAQTPLQRAASDAERHSRGERADALVRSTYASGPCWRLGSTWPICPPRPRAATWCFSEAQSRRGVHEAYASCTLEVASPPCQSLFCIAAWRI